MQRAGGLRFAEEGVHLYAMNLPALTPRQQQVLDFIAAWQAAEGHPPTLREIAEGLGLRQHSSAQGYLDVLVRKGWLARDSRHRGLRLLGPVAVDDAAEAEGHDADDARPDRSRPARAANDDDAPLWLPLVGRVAAGAPILSEGHVEARYAVDPALFRPRPDFLLKVEGDSMIDAGIRNGDLIAVHRTPEATVGQIVVARLEGEITVKRLSRRSGGLWLLPANPDYAPIRVPDDASDFAIEGLYVGVIRRG